MEVAPAEDETLCSSAVTAVRWAHTTQCSHWVDALCSYAHISGYLCRKWMGCLSCQVVSIHYAKFLQQNINAAAWLHSEHCDDAVCPCTPSLLSVNISYHHASHTPQNSFVSKAVIHNPKLWWGKAQSEVTHTVPTVPLVVPLMSLSDESWVLSFCQIFV